jgi:hypothetical protein
MKRTIATAWLAVLPKTGHALNLEVPALFNALGRRIFPPGRGRPLDHA